MSNFNPEDVKIRHVMHIDIDSILSLHKRIGIPPSNITNMISSGFGGPLDFSFVAEYNKKVVGVIIAHLMYIYIPVIETCVINGIMVDPYFKKRGVATKLANELFKFCRSQNVNKVRAFAEDTNEELNEFVKFLGFKPSHIVSWDKEL